MTRLFLHFWNLVPTFRVWSSIKKNAFLNVPFSNFGN